MKEIKNENGKMLVSFAVCQDDIFTEVAKVTGYIGAKTNNGESFDVIAVVEENSELLENYFKESANEIAQMTIGVFVGDSFEINQETSKNEYKITLDLTENYKPELYTLADRNLFAYFLASVTAKWLLLMGREDAVVYSTQASDFFDKFKWIVLKRTGIRRKLKPF